MSVSGVSVFLILEIEWAVGGDDGIGLGCSFPASLLWICVVQLSSYLRFCYMEVST